MAGLTVYGAPWCPDCRRTKQFLGEHRIAYEWIDVDEDARGLQRIEALQNGGRTIPTVVFEDGDVLLEPSNEELARKLELTLEAECAFYDLAIVGGGPAGLAVAIYAAREGIRCIVIDRSALGGQAGLTKQIDNYPGFPEGIEGAELADRFIAQARRYDVELLSAVGVERFDFEGQDQLLHLSTGQQVGAHAVIIATGSTYRRMEVPGEEGLIGAGVHFCATCDGPFYAGADELLVVGGGNSALEEGLFLTQFAKRVRIVARSELTGSLVLQESIASRDQIVVHTNTEVTALQGTTRVEGVEGRNKETGETYAWQPAAVFVFVGMTPNTEVVEGVLDLDEHGFVATDARFRTSVDGVFAAGDVRAGSTKQLGAAVGEGITALMMVREYLQAQSHLRRQGIA